MREARSESFWRVTELDRDVVIGVLNRRQIESDSLNRLRREAKAMARLMSIPMS